MDKRRVIDKKKKIGSAVVLIVLLVVVDIVLLTWANSTKNTMADRGIIEVPTDKEDPAIKNPSGEKDEASSEVMTKSFAGEWGGSSWVGTNDPSATLYLSPEATVIEQREGERQENSFSILSMVEDGSVTTGRWEIAGRTASFTLTQANDGVVIESAAFGQDEAYKLSGGGGGGDAGR